MNSKILPDNVESPQESIKGGHLINGHANYFRTNNSSNWVYYGSNCSSRNKPECSKRHTFFRIFPPIRFFLDTSKAIEILQSLKETVLDEDGNEIKDTKAGVIKLGDIGFNDIVTVIKDNNNIKGDIGEVVFQERNMGVVLNLSSGIETALQIRDAKGEGLITISDPFDAGKPIRELKTWVEERFRRKIAYWTLILIVVWLIANTYILVNSIISRIAQM